MSTKTVDCKIYNKTKFIKNVVVRMILVITSTRKKLVFSLKSLPSLCCCYDTNINYKRHVNESGMDGAWMRESIARRRYVLRRSRDWQRRQGESCCC